MTTLIFKNSTKTINPPLQRPPIDVRPIGDLTLDLDGSVNINANGARSSFNFRGSQDRP